MCAFLNRSYPVVLYNVVVYLPSKNTTRIVNKWQKSI